MSSPAVSQLQNSSSSTLILPYGYQIDLDFIKYCENLANIDHTDAELQRRNRRRQRQSMEVMLGIQLEMQQQMNQMNEFWEEKKAPEPPPRTHLHSIESPIVPKYTARSQSDTKWDPALSEVVSDFEKTLERSKKGKESEINGIRRDFFDNCIPSGQNGNNTASPPYRPPRQSSQPLNDTRQSSQSRDCHVSIESIDGSSLAPSVSEKRVLELEEQTKLIPLLQMQIQSLKDERKQLVQQLEASRASSASSSTSSQPPQQQHTHFQVHRVSPVSLSSMKLNTSVMAKRSVGINTTLVHNRDVGVMSDKPQRVNASTITDFRLPCDSNDGGRLYSEKDLKKTVELVHAKMRRAMVSIGVQHSEEKKLSRDVASGTRVSLVNSSSNTEEPHLMVSSIKSITIAPEQQEQQSFGSSLSLKDMSKPPITRNSSSQTTQGAVYSQGIQVMPNGAHKATDSVDLVMKVNRASGTEAIYRKDQNCHTGDLIKVHNVGSNTAAEKVVAKRTTASNTDTKSVRNVGINVEIIEATKAINSDSSRAVSEELNEPVRPISRAAGQFDLSDHRPLAARSSIERILRHDDEPSSDPLRKSFREKSPFSSSIGPKPATPLKLTSSIPTFSKTSPSVSTSTTTTVTQLTKTTIDPISINHSDSNSKIPRPSPNPTRKYMRQDTFTVTTSPPPSQSVKSPTTTVVGNSSSLFSFRKTPEKSEQQEVTECPVEKMLKLTMNHHRSPSPPPPVQKSPEHSPERVIEEQVEEENPPESTSKMVMSPSVEYLDDDDEEEEEDDDEYDEDEFNDEQLPSSMPLRPPPTSISTIRLVREGRVRTKPSKEMIAALKVINDHLEKYPEPIESQIQAARDIVACEWFKISSTEKANPDDVEDYLDYFEEQSWDLLTYMVNLTDKNGNMAMHYAVSHGNFDVVSLLLDSKVCNINQTNNAGYTCIMLVSLAKLFIAEHRTVVQRLFKLADVNIRASKNSQTALMLAVSHGNLEIVQMMVEAGADINIQDDDGSTALMCSAEQGHLDIVKFLLAQPDCDSTKTDVDGNTALKISLEAGYHDIGCLLYAHEHLIRSKAGVKRASSRKSSTSSLT